MSIIYEKKDRIAYFTMSTPEGMNTFTPDEILELNACLQDFSDDPDVWVGILTGAGEKAFSAGGNLKRHNTKFEEEFSDVSRSQHYWYPKTEPVPAWYAWGQTPDVFKPMIAAVNGYCLGFGLMLMLRLTDIRIAAPHAKFGFTEHKRGFGGSAGPKTRILQQIPYAIAMEMLLYGDSIDAEKAERYGLINRVVPLEELLPTAEDYARRLLEVPPLSARAVKESAIRSWRGEIPEHLVNHYVPLLGAMVHQGEDLKEGLSAFVEKRKPNFKGR